jgi:hypothetical protein
LQKSGAIFRRLLQRQQKNFFDPLPFRFHREDVREFNRE